MGDSRLKIGKDIKFDCCHMLSHYEGKCKNLHGHTYHGLVSIIAEPDEDTRMVLDYNVIKQVVDTLDHCVVFSDEKYRDEAEDRLLEWTQLFRMKHVILQEGKSTAEDIARYLAKKVWEKAVSVTSGLPLYERSVSVHVTLSETDGSYAEAEYASED